MSEKIQSKPLFWIALLFKVSLSSFYLSDYSTEYFIPVASYVAHNGLFSDPWRHFAELGQLDQFPYPSLMLYLLTLPYYVTSLLVPLEAEWSIYFKNLLIHVPVLVFDYLLLNILISWHPKRVDRVLLLYWCCPALIFISYFYGQLDVIPTGLLFVSLYLLFKRHWIQSGLAIGASVATKWHTIVFVPLVIPYILKNISHLGHPWRLLGLFCFGLFLPLAFFIAPWSFNSDFVSMVFYTPQAMKVFSLKMDFGHGTLFYALPFVLTLLYLRYLQTARLNKDLLLTYLAFVFSAFVFFVPPRAGWYYWMIPFVVNFLIRGKSDTLFWLFNGAYIVFFGLFEGSHAFMGFLHEDQIHLLRGGVFSIMQALVCMLAIKVYKQGLQNNRFYHSKNKSFLIGIGGDSGAGKDTFSDTVKGLLGSDNLIQMDGDDYHRWERGHQEWQSKTHLDPMANQMELPYRHMKTMKEGGDVYKKKYDHGTGQFTKELLHKNRSFVLYIGLHPFYLEKTRQLLDLKIFLSPNDRLRNYWKIARDKKKRGYTKEQVLENIRKRRSDSDKYIKPQKDYADWIVNYEPIEPIGDDYEVKKEVQLKVRHFISSALDLEDLVLALRDIDTLSIHWSYDTDIRFQCLEVQGSISSAQIAAIGSEMFPHLNEIVSGKKAHWREDYDGINQILFLLFVERKVPLWVPVV